MSLPFTQPPQKQTDLALKRDLPILRKSVLIPQQEKTGAASSN